MWLAHQSIVKEVNLATITAEGNIYSTNLDSLCSSLSLITSPHLQEPSSLTRTKTHIYQALVQSVLLYASETWTRLSVNSTDLEAFRMKCQRQLLQIKWHQFIRKCGDYRDHLSSLRPSVAAATASSATELGWQTTFQPTRHPQSNQPIARPTTKQPVVPSSRSSS